VRLIANGASKSDIQTQTDLSAAKQKDMANILKVNPTIVTAAGVAGNTDPALVSKAISGLVAKAAVDTSGAVQLTAAQVQAAQVALQQIKAAAGSTTTASVTSSSAADVSSMLNTLTKTAATYSIKSLPGDAATPSTVPTVQVATTSATVPVVSTQAAPAVDKSEFTPAVVQMLQQSGSAAIQAMQNAQAAALAKGDKALADGLGKDIVNLQAQVAVAKSMPAPTIASLQAPTGPAVVATSMAATVTPPPVAASTTAVVAPTFANTPALAPAKQEPTKITSEQGLAVQQSLRTIPGNLNASEQKTFSNLSTLVDRAVTKGLTAEEAVTLKSGLAALADKHPKAEKQHGLTALANTVAVRPALAAKPAATSGTELKALATAAPDSKVMQATGAAAVSAREAAQEKRPASSAVAAVPVTVPVVASRESLPRQDKPAEITGTKPTIASTAPTVRVEAPVAKPNMIRTPVPSTPQVHVQEPKPMPQVTAPKPPVNTQAMRVEPKPQPVAPRPPTPQVVTPRPTVASSAPVVVKPPAAKPQTCTPNMVNGKMMGMTCH
jgi:hypothetical protein